MSGSGVVTSGGDTKVSGAMTFGLTFSENVSNFSATDVSVNSGTISSVSGSNKNYTVAYTPANNVDGNVVLTVAGGNYNDSVGNSGVGSTKTFAVDTKSPTGQLTLPSGTFTLDQKMTFTLSYDETVAITGGDPFVILKIGDRIRLAEKEHILMQI